MSNRIKIKEILAGKELLTINSQHKQVPKEKRMRNFTLITGVYIFGIIFCLWLYCGQNTPQIILLPIIITLLYGVLSVVFIFYLNNRGNPLVFTDKGIVLPYIAANFWSEIESYEWEEFKGWNKVPGPNVFSMAEGTCLRINLRGAMSLLTSRWRDGKGGNILATYLIFFSSEQVIKAEAILSEYAILQKR